MRVINLLWSIGLSAAALSAQGPGIAPEWETRKLIDNLVSNTRKLEPLVNGINPADWKEKGAPDTYHAQWQSVRNALGGLSAASAQLAKDPTRISFALDTLFRLDALNVYLGSFAAGVRRYQNPALADLLQGVADENSANRESLRQYALDLAGTKEAELKVMESEAQRCLGIILKQPPAVSRPAQKPKAPPPAGAAAKDRP